MILSLKRSGRPITPDLSLYKVDFVNVEAEKHIYKDDEIDMVLMPLIESL